MKIQAKIITIRELEQSIKIAERCKESAVSIGKLNIDQISFFSAITPKNSSIDQMLDQFRINKKLFLSSPSSRPENVIACFLSHYSLWKDCIEKNTITLILEHDAIFKHPVDTILHQFEIKQIFEKNPIVISLGHPSYGRFKLPKQDGLSQLFSKPYLPGAHAYLINPEAARILIKRAVINAEATDIFLSHKNFNFIYEWYPWPIVVDEYFTTVQCSIFGCEAKHGYQKNKKSYQIL